MSANLNYLSIFLSLIFYLLKEIIKHKKFVLSTKFKYYYRTKVLIFREKYIGN